jgi:glutathione S-transferase
MIDYPLTTLAIVASLFVFFSLAIVVGRARATWNVPAPMSTGHPEFEKRFRVQMNTLEQLIMFLPAIMLAAPVLGDLVAALLGFTWCVGRILYARLYYADPAKRGPGFGLSFLPTLILLLAAAWGGISALLA